MNRKKEIARLDRNNRGEAALAALIVPETPGPESEARQLARDIMVAFVKELDKYRQLASDKQPNQDQSPEKEIEAILELQPQMVTFFHLEQVSRVDPARAYARWEEMKAAARADLANGTISAFALEHVGGSAWERAMFVALREQLFRAWLPRHAGEAMLLEEMAQYETIRQKWICIISHWSRDPRIQHSLRNPDCKRQDEQDHCRRGQPLGGPHGRALAAALPQRLAHAPELAPRQVAFHRATSGPDERRHGSTTQCMRPQLPGARGEMRCAATTTIGIHRRPRLCPCGLAP
jgi:hypothetical protein